MNLKNLLLTTSMLLLSTTAILSAESADFNEYEIYSTAKTNPNPYTYYGTKPKETLFKLTPRNSINSSGLGGLFVAETAEKLTAQQMVLSSRYKYRKLSSTKGQAFYTTEDGDVASFETSLTWIGRWAEWSVTVPIQEWSLSAPRTFHRRAQTNNGLGNIAFGFKYTDLKDHSYYRFALGACCTCDTGNSNDMAPAGSNDETSTKIYGCVTTKETDRATANLELGALINKEDEDWFIYNFGITYDVTPKVSFIGEIVGEVAGGDDKDNMDMVLGFRFAPVKDFTFEVAYYRNLRTYREYGWDNQFQIGASKQW
ncbi:MAG: transporter [Candidatus Riflebacteria bacterium]|nr:transporter [Candidatus Riflebacteria bacterium]